MTIILLILIIFFLYLITFQLLTTNFNSSIIEGMIEVSPTISPDSNSTFSPTNEMLPNLTINQVYRQYDKKIADNTFLMAQQNAGNIEYLKQRVDSLQNLNSIVHDLSGNVSVLQNQVNGLLMAQQQFGKQMTEEVKVPKITGLSTSNNIGDITQ